MDRKKKFGLIGGAGVAEIVNESVFMMGMIFFGGSSVAVSP